MSVLHLNVGIPRLGNFDKKTVIKSKADYLMLAAEEMGVDWVRRYDGPCDYILNIHPYHKDYGIVEWRKGYKWTGNWEMDILTNKVRTQESWDNTDTVFLCNRFKWQSKPANFEMLYEACWPALYNYDIKPDVDIVQCGTIEDVHHWKDFGANGPSADTDIYSERRRLYKLLETKYSVRWTDGYYSTQEYIENLAHARVQFIQSMNVLGENEIAQRFWESLPIGPVLTCYSPTLDGLDLIEGEDYLCYRSDEDLFDKMDKLLSDDKYRNKIWQNGRKKAFDHHTYKDRLTQLITYLRKNYGF